ncbi:MAG: flippase-like domain-containing protein [Magnetococcales bacterium]|nr:flippase-like domain-containing protein [Magnetococcales bacterium]MBF0322320.1 flippase-like domain-containing protein [Magnetococcales bacterium]
MSWLRKALPVILSLALFYWVFRHVETDSLWSVLRSTRFEWVALVPLLVGLGLFFKAWRWRALLTALDGQVTLWTVFSGMSLGTLVDQVIPGKVGELVRSHRVGRKIGISRAAVFGTVVVERLFDMFSVMTISAVAILGLGLHHHLLDKSLILGGALLMVLVVGLLVFLQSRSLLLRMVGVILPRTMADKVSALLERITQGFQTLGHWRHSGRALLGTLLMWGCLVIAFMPLLYAMGFTPAPPLHTAFVLIFLTAVGIAIPTAPGGMGIYEFVAYLSLSITLPAGALETPEMAARTAVFGVLYHITSLVPELLAGFYCLNREFPGLGLERALAKLRPEAQGSA